MKFMRVVASSLMLAGASSSWGCVKLSPELTASQIENNRCSPEFISGRPVLDDCVTQGRFSRIVMELMELDGVCETSASFSLLTPIAAAAVLRDSGSRQDEWPDPDCVMNSVPMHSFAPSEDADLYHVYILNSYFLLFVESCDGNRFNEIIYSLKSLYRPSEHGRDYLDRIPEAAFLLGHVYFECGSYDDALSAFSDASVMGLSAGDRAYRSLLLSQFN